MLFRSVRRGGGSRASAVDTESAVRVALIDRGGDRQASVAEDQFPRSFEGRPVVMDGWYVSASATDAPERASFKDGTLRLDANSGILLTVEKRR